MLSLTDAARRTATVVPDRKRYSRIPEVLPIPDLIELQRDSFRWFIDHGLRELFDEISPIQDFTGKVMELHFKAVRVRRAQVLRAGVPHPRPDLLQAALRGRRAAHQGDRRDPGAAGLHGRLPDHDRPGHVHHQRRRARRGQPAGPLAGRLLHRDRGPGHRPQPLQRQGHPEPRRLAGVRDRGPQPAVRQGRPQAQARGDQAAARRGLRVERGDDRAVLASVDTGEQPYIASTLEKDSTSTRQEALIEVYKKLRPGDPPTGDNAEKLVESLFFNFRRYDLGRVGRYKFNKKLDPIAERMGIELSRDAADHQPRGHRGHRRPAHRAQQRHRPAGRHRPPGQPPHPRQRRADPERVPRRPAAHGARGQGAHDDPGGRQGHPQRADQHPARSWRP